MGRDRRRLGLGLALSGWVAAASPAAAQPAEGNTIRREGEYGGVNPGGSGETPDPAGKPGKPKRPPAKKTLLWVGFTAKDGGASELFFQAVDAFTVSQRLEGKTLVVVLEGLKGQAKNTRRPLDTRFFETSLARVTAKKVGAKRAHKGAAGHAAGVEIRIAFKDPRDVREGALRTGTGPDQMFYAYLDFGAPTEPAAKPDSGGGGSTMQDPEGE